MKKIIHNLHLWLGLSSSIVLFLVCLSGTVLVFQEEILAWSRPQQNTFSIPENQARSSLGKLIAELESQTGGKVTHISVPADLDRPYHFQVRTNPEERRGQRYSVNPYTGEILNNPNERSNWFFFFFRLHRWLLLDPELGRPIVGIATLIYTFLLLSGLYMWWPKGRKHLVNSLKVKLTGNIIRLNYDLHNTLGFYSMIFLLVMSLTGLCWSFEWYRNVTSTLLGAKIFDRGGRPAEVVPGETRLELEAFLTRFPTQGETMISLPLKKTDSLVLTHYRGGVQDKFEINPYTGEILKELRFSDKSFGEKIASLIKSLHVGDFMGTFSKIIYFITCLIGTTLPITGFFIWFNKRRKHV